jgi:hypothetical protein
MSTFGLNGPSQMQPQGLPGMGGTQMGGGIAGVASESKGPSIIVFNERKKYNEWEFIYDQSKDRGLAGVQRNGGAPGTPAGQMGSIPGQQPGMGGTQSNSPFGSSPGGSNGFGFSSSPGGSGSTSTIGSQGMFGSQPSPPQSTPQPQQPPQ